MQRLVEPAHIGKAGLEAEKEHHVFAGRMTRDHLFRRQAGVVRHRLQVRAELAAPDDEREMVWTPGGRFVRRLRRGGPSPERGESGPTRLAVDRPGLLGSLRWERFMPRAPGVGEVAIAVEAYMQLRHVYTAGRPHPKDPDPLFNGVSIGHWEGDTLVVSTTGFVPWSMISPGVGHSDEMRIDERIHRIGPDRIEIRQTITDPKVLAEPWTVSHSYKLVKDDLREYECEQNNHDSADDEGRPGLKVK